MKNNALLVFLLIGVMACQNSDKNIEFEQYTISGEILYKQHCANCHGKNGEGLRDLYPPLSNTEFIKNKVALICIIKNGSTKALNVNGKIYDEKMPRITGLYDIDVAQIVTFIQAKWAKKNTITKPNEVQSAKCFTE